MSKSPMDITHLVNETKFRYEKFSCQVKSIISIVLIIGMVANVGLVGPIIIISLLLASLGYGATTAFYWYIYRKRKLQSGFRYLIFLIDMLVIQVITFLLAFSPGFHADYALENISLIGLTIVAIIASGLVHLPRVPLIMTGIAIVGELVILILIAFSNNGQILFSPQDVGLQVGVVSARMEIYKLITYAAVGLSMMLVSRLQIRMRDDIIGHNQELQNKHQELESLMGKSHKMIEMSAELKTTASEIHNRLTNLQVQGADVESVFQAQVDMGKQTSHVIKEMNSIQSEIRLKLSTQSDLVGENAHQFRSELHKLKEIDEFIQKSVELITQLANQATKGEEHIKELIIANQEIDVSAKNIEEMLASITSIAKQTNLLALNASIEAAHAGEAGSGFAVVAEEVRSLAGNASTTAREVTDLVKDMLAKTESGVTFTQTISKQFEVIRNESTESAKQIADISQAIQKHRKTSDQFLHSTEQIVQSNTEIEQISESQDKQAEQVDSIMGNLIEHATKTVVQIEQMMGVLEEIDRMMKDFYNLSVSNEQFIEQITAQRFAEEVAEAEDIRQLRLKEE
jgi:methyl-accepting chemotaxis protein